jgi:hypothetical protein
MVRINGRKNRGRRGGAENGRYSNRETALTLPIVSNTACRLLRQVAEMDEKLCDVEAKILEPAQMTSDDQEFCRRTAST